MAILLSSIWTLLFGGAVVALTSPTFDPAILREQHWVLAGHAILVDGLFAFLISYIILCHIEHRWIAQELSFPYSCQLSWNFQPQAFDFQLLTFELFHINWLSRTTHIVTITTEVALWMYTINATFGWSGSLLVLILLVAQSISYKDVLLAVVLCAVYVGLAVGSALLRSSLPQAWIGTDLFVLKTILLYVGTIQTLCHALEPLPPNYDEHLARFDDSFGRPGWVMILHDPLRSGWLFALGQVSELSAGLPGRYMSQVVYKILYKMGHRSSMLQDVSEIKRQGMIIINDGWQGHETTAAMYSWAITKQDPLIDLNEKQDA